MEDLLAQAALISPPLPECTQPSVTLDDSEIRRLLPFAKAGNKKAQEQLVAAGIPLDYQTSKDPYPKMPTWQQRRTE